MSEGQAGFPDFVEKKLREMSEKFLVPYDSLVAEFSQLVNDPWVKEEFKDENEAYLYCLRVLYVRYAAQPPTKTFIVIPFGIMEPRITKTKGIRQSRIYVLVKTSEGFEKRVIICRGAMSDIVYNVELFSAYKVQLAEYGNILLATSTTKFIDPKPINVNPLDFLVKYVDVTPVRIADTPDHLSRRNNGFVDELDLKLVRGIVLNYNKGQRPDGSEWAVYTIADDSVPTQPQVRDDGVVVPTQFTVWVPPSMLKYDVDSELAFCGTISLNKDKVPFMNAICVIPIHARAIPV